MDRILPLIDYQLQASELGKLIKEERDSSIKREAMFNELCKLLGVNSVEELLLLVKSGKIGYIHESEGRTYELSKLHSLAPRPFVMPKGGKSWYKQFGNKNIRNEEQGYTCVVNTMYDGETYVKVAKCTKGHSVVRLRIENVSLIK